MTNENSKRKIGTVLIVDDNTANLNLISQVFSDEHLEISFAKNGIDAVNLAKIINFDLAILDVNLPDISGFQVSEQLRKLQPACEQIFCTALNDRVLRDKAFTAGAIDFIEKPFELASTRMRLKLHMDRLNLRFKFETESKNLENMVASLQDAVVTTDLHDIIQNWNVAAQTLFGVNAEKIIGTPFSQFVPDELKDMHRAALKKYRHGAGGHLVGSKKQVRLQAKCFDGTLKDVSFMLSSWNQGSQEFVTAIIRDVSQQIALEKNIEGLRNVIDASPTIMARLDKDGKLLWASASAEKLFFLNQDKLVASEEGPLNEIFFEFIADTHSQESLTFELDIENDYGPNLIMTATFSLVGNTKDEVLLIITDITDIRLTEAKALRLHNRVRTDELTGCVSRSGFVDDFADGLRSSDFYLLILDIDYFKSVNDIYGHTVGDQYLKALVKALMEGLPDAATVARLGGEEFAILYPANKPLTISTFAKMVHEVSKNVTLIVGDSNLNRSVSIGAALLPRMSKISTCLTAADESMRSAKEAGRNSIKIADNSSAERIALRLLRPSWEQITKALTSKEIIYYLQPVVDLKTARTVGFEALIRWNTEEGIKSPDFFLKEYYQVTNVVNRGNQRFQIFKELLESLDENVSGWVSLNVQLSDLLDGRCDELILVLEGLIKIRPIVIELSEEVINDRINAEDVAAILQRLRLAGFLIALDDFGKEGSNFNRLSVYPIDIVKIDKFFVDNITTDLKAKNMIKALATLAKDSNFQLIAEGIETQEQSDSLLRLGIFLHQGFYYAKPQSQYDIVFEPLLYRDEQEVENKYEKSRYSILEDGNVVSLMKTDAFFKNIIESASRYFVIQGVALTVIDAINQHFPLSLGPKLDSIPRLGSICDATVKSDDVFQISDIKYSEKYKNKTLLNCETDEVKFYVSAPLVVFGHRIGTILLFDGFERTDLNELEVLQLTFFAQLVSDRIMSASLTSTPMGPKVTLARG